VLYLNVRNSKIDSKHQLLTSFVSYDSQNSKTFDEREYLPFYYRANFNTNDIE